MYLFSFTSDVCDFPAMQSSQILLTSHTLFDLYLYYYYYYTIYFHLFVVDNLLCSQYSRLFIDAEELVRVLKV